MSRRPWRPRDGTMRAILRQIDALGYHVSVHRLPPALNLSGALTHFDQPFTEMNAVNLADTDEKHIARVFGERGGGDVPSGPASWHR